MGRRGKSRRERVDGILLLSKPPGLSSNQALQRIKYRLNAEKAGHTGSLDPAATGLLPLCFGEATKISAYLLDADKVYRVVARLGRRTDSGDATGAFIAESNVPALSEDDWREVLNGFLGDTTQVPPMYSALKKDGKRLYELARKGEEVEREPRPVNISRIELLEFAGRRLVFRVCCSKGTYVRTLVEDIAAKAGTLAYTHSLHREAVGAFEELRAVDWVTANTLEPDELKRRLLPPDQALAFMPRLDLTGRDSERFVSGQAVSGSTTPGFVRLYNESDEFLGVGESDATGTVAPKRVFRLSPDSSAPL
ncbi:MAG: tRNA pseudouridine(55) synthase TruB [Pseudomonadota bacterium]